MTALRHALRGRGAILMFHEIHEADDSELRTGVSAAFLDRLLFWFRENGWHVVSLDECARRLAANDPSDRFVSLTFDDGYRDNVTRALPILERYDAPFTVYVPTGAVDRSLFSWWLGLRRLFQTHDDVDIPPLARRFQCSSADEKVAALDVVCNWIHQDYRRQAELVPIFDAYSISLPSLNDAYFLGEEELRALADHPLATIGGHTVSHPALTLLSDSHVYRELEDNRSYLANLLQRPVDHFAYPYGNSAEREFDIAANVGFSTAVTTRTGVLSSRTGGLHRLPRLGLSARETVLSLEAKVSGVSQVATALRSRFA